MKVFIDFDDVIFNTHKFVVDIKKAFRKYGIDDELFQKSYIDYPIKNKNGTIKKYEPSKHIDTLEREFDFDGRKLREDVEKITKDASSYVFSDVAGFLKNFGKNNFHVISYGDTDFQEEKIANCGISKLVKTITVSDKFKSDSIKKIIGKHGIELIDEQAYFIDDRVEQIIDVKKTYPEIRTVLLKRKEGRYDDKKNKFCDFECKNLRQVEKIILK